MKERRPGAQEDMPEVGQLGSRPPVTEGNAGKSRWIYDLWLFKKTDVNPPVGQAKKRFPKIRDYRIAQGADAN